MDWWLWVAGGLALMVLELVTPSGFFIMFFGLGALSVGALTWIGLVAAGWLQWLLFTLLALGFIAVFRGQFPQLFRAAPPPTVDSLVGVLAVPQAAIEPGAVGRVEVRGSTWSARNAGQAGLAMGQRCTVVSVDGLLLTVRPE
ncbi:MAG TPA: NfeD family protein [Vicinamibacterales bacterium]|nr:NfeD family protein [Vicinamibacterales bacterium]